MTAEDLLAALEKLVEEDSRYRLEAYVFIMNALEVAISRKPVRGHVTGKELLDGVRDYGQHVFGPTARMVFEHWGVRQTEDFGNIVFKLVGAGILGKTETDSLEDFASGFDFREVLEKQYDWKIREPL